MKRSSCKHSRYACALLFFHCSVSSRRSDCRVRFTVFFGRHSIRKGAASFPRKPWCSSSPRTSGRFAKRRSRCVCASECVDELLCVCRSWLPSHLLDGPSRGTRSGAVVCSCLIRRCHCECFVCALLQEFLRVSRDPDSGMINYAEYVNLLMNSYS
jgi:hypothetical protein